MKINWSVSLFLLLAAAGAAFAQDNVTVVKQDGDRVYMDTSVLNRHVQKGDSFKIITGREPLINPKTGKSLGEIYTYSPEGVITEVQKLYAVGEIKNAAKYAAGAEAVIEASAAQAALSVSSAATENATPVSSKKVITYEPVDQTIISLSEGFINRRGQIITLSDKGVITVFDKKGEKLVPALTAALPSSYTPITLSADDVKETGADQIFVSYYNPARQEISTAVLEAVDGVLSVTQTLPYFVKELGCGKDKDVWAQKPFVLGSRPGDAQELDYKNGRFYLDGDKLDTRRNWLTGVNEYDLEKDGDNFIYTASNGSLRAELAKKRRAESKDVFAGAPNRVKYKQDVLKFYPSVQVYGPDGSATVAAVENTAKIGVLSDMFGQYKSGKIHFLTLQKGRLTITDTVELDGYVYDTACSDDAVLAAEVLPDGTSAVREIFK